MGLGFSAPPSGGDGGGGFPETVSEYAEYWNNADVEISANDAKLKNPGLTISILSEDTITPTQAATILSDQYIPSLPTAAASTDVVSVFSTSNRFSLNTVKAQDIAATGVLNVDDLGFAFYAIESDSEALDQVIPASFIAELVENGYGGYSDFELAEAVSLYNSIDNTYYGNKDEEVNRLNNIVSDDSVSSSRIRDLFVSGGVQQGGDNNDIDKLVWGIFITGYDPADSAADIEVDAGGYGDATLGEAVNERFDAEPKGYYTADGLAKVFDNDNLSVARATATMGDEDNEIASVFTAPSFRVSRGAALWNEGEINNNIPVPSVWDEVEDQDNQSDYQKLADSIDHPNLTRGNAKSIWRECGDAFQSSKGLANISGLVQDVTKILSLFELYHSEAIDTPDGGQGALGGDDTTIWHTNHGGTVYELSTSDFSTIRTSSSPDSSSRGVGGTADVIWLAGRSGSDVFELDTNDLSVVRQSGAPSNDPSGIGGDANTIWYSQEGGFPDDAVAELATSDFSLVRESGTEFSYDCSIGGESGRIWAMEDEDAVAALATSDFSEIERDDTNIYSPNDGGIGGTADTIWGQAGDRLGELKSTTQ